VATISSLSAILEPSEVRFRTLIEEGTRMKRQRYEIRVEGHLATDWSDWFEGLTVCQEVNGETVLSGPLDQAALHGVLAKVRDLGLTLVAVNRVIPREELS
jgi:hypothetical protein